MRITRLPTPTFDDLTVLNAAKSCPKAFVDSFTGQVIFEEVQRAPEIFLAIKEVVDKNAENGKFLLTGSANVLLSPKIADSLAGRMEVISLRPLSQDEIDGKRCGFIDWVCSDEFKLPSPLELEPRDKLFERVLTGGYPEVINRRTEGRRKAWFNSYVTTMLQRDVREIANTAGTSDLPRLLSILAARATGLISYAEISRSSGIPQSTLKRYIALLKSLFLIEELPAYSGNISRRLMKSSKLFFTDTGLLASLRDLNWKKIKFEPTYSGSIMENFVVSELKKQQGWAQNSTEMLHFRTSNDQEVDIVLELPNGEVVGIEVKAGATVSEKSFKGLKIFEEAIGKKFKRGIVLYTGESSVSFGTNMFAIPVQTLWN